MSSLKQLTGVEAFGNTWVVIATLIALIFTTLVFLVGGIGLLSFADGVKYVTLGVLGCYLPGFIWTSLYSKPENDGRRLLGMTMYRKLYEEEKVHAGYWEMIANILAKKLSSTNGIVSTPAQLINEAKFELPDLRETLENTRNIKE